MIRQGCQVFASSPPDDISLQSARDFIKANDLTADDVKIMKGEDNITVVTKREINLKL